MIYKKRIRYYLVIIFTKDNVFHVEVQANSKRYAKKMVETILLHCELWHCESKHDYKLLVRKIRK